MLLLLWYIKCSINVILYRSVTNITPLAQLFFKGTFWVRIEVMHFNETIKIIEVKCQFTVCCDIQDKKDTSWN